MAAAAPVNVFSLVFSYVDSSSRGGFPLVCREWRAASREGCGVLCAAGGLGPFFKRFAECLRERNPGISNEELGKRVIQEIPQILHEAQPLLGRKEWGAKGFNFTQTPMRQLTYRQMIKVHIIISEKRADQLIAIFSRIRNCCTQADTFGLTALSDDLSSLDKARKIRTWMRDNQALLDNIIDLQLTPTDPLFKQMPPEIAFLRNFNLKDLERAFLFSAGTGKIATIRALIGLNRFHGLALGRVGRSLVRAAANGHEAVVRAIIGKEEVALPKFYIRTAFMEGARRGHVAVVETIIQLRGDELRGEPIALATRLAGEGGHVTVIQAIDQWQQRIR